MKFDFPPRAAPRDSAIRPGFDVLLAVTGARQAASPTARLVAGRRSRSDAVNGGAPHGSLLPPGRTSDGQAVAPAARFADVALGAVPDLDSCGATNTEMKSPFTRAFQPMVKHEDVEGPLNAERPNGDCPGME